MVEQYDNALRDVRQYSEELLTIRAEEVCIPVTYKKSWDDGFGARGWKLNATIGDPEIIASTRETGQKINTSVFVHDILDHFLSGFGVSGHRSEAMALIQLSKRTNSDPSPDYEQMVREDIINGRVNGESLTTFLPKQLLDLLPSGVTMTDSEMMSFLKQTVGEVRLVGDLIGHFFTLGKAGEQHAIDSWTALGLNPERRTEIGLALQALLEEIDAKAEYSQTDEAEGLIRITKSSVSFAVSNTDPRGAIEACCTY